MNKYQFLLKRIPTGNKDTITFDIKRWKDVIWPFVKKNIEKYNDYYLIKISNPKRPRTTGKNSQNHCLNGWIQIFCNETGNDFYQVKMYVKKKAISRGYPIQEDEKGNIQYDLYGDPLPISEADASIEDASLVIQEMEQLAAEYNVTLPERDMFDD